MKTALFKSVVAVSALVVGLSAAQAATTTKTTIAVSASVAAQCAIGAFTNLEFGSYNPASSTDTTAEATVKVTCNAGASATASLSTGSGTYGQRTLKSGTNALNYNLFTSNTYSTTWTDTTTVPVTGGSEQTLTIYGKIPKGQNSVPVGSYTDTVTVTITY